MAVRGLSPEEVEVIFAGSPFMTSTGPKDTASLSISSLACSVVKSPTLNTLFWSKPAAAYRAVAPWNSLSWEMTSPRGMEPLPRPPSSSKPLAFTPATAP